MTTVSLFTFIAFGLSIRNAHAWDPKTFKKPTEAELREKLDPLSFKVTQRDGTEPPFKNEYWDNKREGIYVDKISGEPLFCSCDKYDSGTGWPSFTRAMVPDNILEKEDRSLFTTRTEIRSKHAYSHLGHVFDDGPAPTGKRYCMNSAALRFIPKEEMAGAGYGEYLKLFGLAGDKTGTKSSESGKALPAVTKTAVFAGGCFWCMQPPFDKLKAEGVLSTRVGYTGGTVDKPTYEQVSSGGTGHREAIEITYDPTKITYARLLETFWQNVDPVDATGQFCDKGEQYTSAVYYGSEEEKKAYESSLQKLQTKQIQGRNVATALLPSSAFYPAEEYHQDYYRKNPVRYKFYRYNCGRDKRLKEFWGKAAP